MFAVGQKVKCVDPKDRLVTGRIYTITKVYDFYVEVNEIPHIDFFASRFVPAGSKRDRRLLCAHSTT